MRGEWREDWPLLSGGLLTFCVCPRLLWLPLTPYPPHRLDITGQIWPGECLQPLPALARDRQSHRTGDSERLASALWLPHALMLAWPSPGALPSSPGTPTPALGLSLGPHLPSLSAVPLSEARGGEDYSMRGTQAPSLHAGLDQRVTQSTPRTPDWPRRKQCWALRPCLCTVDGLACGFLLQPAGKAMGTVSGSICSFTLAGCPGVLGYQIPWHLCSPSGFSPLWNFPDNKSNF